MIGTKPVDIQHQVIIDGARVAVYGCLHATVLAAIGGCRFGCCDDDACPDCGTAVRVAWPD